MKQDNDMLCSNCGKETNGGYCDCMIVDGEFKGAWWGEDKKRVTASLRRCFFIRFVALLIRYE